MSTQTYESSKTITLDTELDITTAPQASSKSWKHKTVTWGDFIDRMKEVSSVKNSEAYVFGELRGSRRLKEYVRSRCAVTLDADHPVEGFLERVADVLDGVAHIWHTTYSSTPERPRYRVIVPLDSKVPTNEYEMVAKALMFEIDMGSFDRGSSEAYRCMFFPSSQRPAEWFDWGGNVDGSMLSVRGMIRQWTVSSEMDMESVQKPYVSRTKRNPLTLSGWMGAFNRAFYPDWEKLFEEFELPYEPTDDPKRFQYKDATYDPGLYEFRDGLMHSHHAGDPAYDISCSAFDLVRIHRYSHLDDKNHHSQTPVNRLPSTLAMIEDIKNDPRVQEQARRDNEEEAAGDFLAEYDDTSGAVFEEGTPSWVKQLSRAKPKDANSTKPGRMLDETENWSLIAKNDPVMSKLYIDTRSQDIRLDGEAFPWRDKREPNPVLGDNDVAAFTMYLGEHYNAKVSPLTLTNVISSAVVNRERDPVDEYLKSVEGTWDGTPRVEECPPGVIPTDYTRMVARKSLVAAVARVKEPGIEWDHMTILYGAEGLGKTRWIRKISKGWSSTLGDIGSKDTLMKIHKTWFVVADEAGEIKKADSNALKSFITEVSDSYRLPYAKTVRDVPRTNVFWGTTNERRFLKRQHGNRRFLFLEVANRTDIDSLSDYYVDQVWAEAIQMYRDGERPFLNSAELKMASENREEFLKDNPYLGVVQEYVDTPKPAGWEKMSRLDRINSELGDFTAEETITINQVCAVQVWHEVIDRMAGKMTWKLDDVTEILDNLPGWYPLPGKQHILDYGPQVVYQRMDDTTKEEFEELVAPLSHDDDDDNDLI